LTTLEAAKEHELAAGAYDAGDQTASELHSSRLTAIN
jgi:hypothetical protein